MAKKNNSKGVLQSNSINVIDESDSNAKSQSGPITIIDELDSNADSQFSTLQEIVENFENPFELVREFLSNSADSNASNVWITYEEDLSSHKTRFIYEDDGEGLKEYTEGKIIHKRLHYFFQLGKSDKRRKPGKIGRKGFGTKISFLSSNIKVESRYKLEDGRFVTVRGELDEPYKTICNRKSLIATETRNCEIHLNSLKGGSGTGTKITIFNFQANEEKFYEPENLIEYIRWFTTGGSVLPFLNRNHQAIQIKVTDKRGNSRDFKGVHNPPPDCNPMELEDSDFSKQRQTVDGQDVILRSHKFAKRVVFQNPKHEFIHTDGRNICFEVCAWILGRAAKDEFASEQMLPDRDRFGLWLSQGGILVQRNYSWITSSPLDCNYHIIVNCDQLELNADRTRIKGKNKSLEKAIKQKFKEYFSEAINNVYKEYKVLKDAEESEIELLETRKQNKERVLILKDRKLWNYSYIKLGLEFEPVSEIEVSALLCALVAQKPDSLPFKLKALFPQGTDAAVEITDTTTNMPHTTMFEVETVLSNFIKHGHPAELSNGIICWKNDLADGKYVKVPRSKRYTAWFRPDGNHLEIYFGKHTLGSIKNLQPIKRIPVYIMEEICRKMEKTAVHAPLVYN